MWATGLANGMVKCWMENVTLLSQTGHFLTADSWLVEKLRFGGLNTLQLFDIELLQNAKEAAKTKNDGKAQNRFPRSHQNGI